MRFFKRMMPRWILHTRKSQVNLNNQSLICHAFNAARYQLQLSVLNTLINNSIEVNEILKERSLDVGNFKNLARNSRKKQSYQC